MSEIYTDPSVSRVVVQELKANAGAKEQNDFLQQGDPYRLGGKSSTKYLSQAFKIIFWRGFASFSYGREERKYCERDMGTG